MISKKISDVMIESTVIERIFKTLNGIEFTIAGGCFSSLMNGENPKDYDVFFKNKDSMSSAITHLQDSNFRCDCTSPYNAVFFEGDVCIQLVDGYYEQSVENLLLGFDFRHCMIAIDSKDNETILSIDDYALAFAREKILKPHVAGISKKPLSSMARAFRLCSRGFSIYNTEDLAIIARAVNIAKVDWEDPIHSPFNGYSDDYQEIEMALNR